MSTNPLLPVIHKMLGHGLGLLAGFGVLASVDFSGSITLGSILIAVVIGAMAAFFTLRAKIADVWRTEAEGERAAKERLQEDLDKERASRAEFDKQQQQLRHELKDQIAGLGAQLQVMEAKTDLSAALEAIKQMNEHTAAALVAAMSDGSASSQRRDETTQALLAEIRDKLPTEPIEKADQPIAVHDIGHE